MPKVTLRRASQGCVLDAVAAVLEDDPERLVELDAGVHVRAGSIVAAILPHLTGTPWEAGSVRSDVVARVRTYTEGRTYAA